MADTDLYLVRHGQTKWSQHHRYTGVTDLELTAAGRVECAKAREVLAAMLGSDLAVDRVYASPMRRAVQSAEVIFGAETFQVTDLLRELNFGELEGLTLAQARRRYPEWTVWESGGPGGESIESLRERADAFLAEYATGHERVAVVAHGYVLRAIAVRALGLAVTAGAMLGMSTASVSLVADRRGRRLIAAWNLCPPGVAAG